jgi:hypothetical protein
MPRHFELEGELLSHDRALGVTRAKHVRVDDFKAKVVCARCHDIITDDIETPAAGPLKELMTGEARLLTVEEQQLLAAWGVKTAATSWGRTRRGRGVPVAHRRHLIERRRCHPNVFVGIARCDGSSVRAIHGRMLITLRESGEVVPIYHFALAFGTIGVFVYGPGDGRRRLNYKDMTSSLVRISPPTGEGKRWPPGRVLSWNDFSALSELDPRAGR